MNRIAWIDTETTGLNPASNAVVQIAVLIEQDGEIIEKAEVKMRPHVGAMINDKALHTNRRTIEEISKWPSPPEGKYKFRKVLEKYVHPRNSEDKFFIAGYNISFDVNMLNSFFKQCGDDYCMSFFYSCFIDVRTTVGEHFLSSDIVLPNYKLKTVCSHFGIQFKAHDAMEDIKATRDLYYELKNAVPA